MGRRANSPSEFAKPTSEATSAKEDKGLGLIELTSEDDTIGRATGAEEKPGRGIGPASRQRRQSDVWANIYGNGKLAYQEALLLSGLTVVLLRNRQQGRNGGC